MGSLQQAERPGGPDPRVLALRGCGLLEDLDGTLAFISPCLEDTRKSLSLNTVLSRSGLGA